MPPVLQVQKLTTRLKMGKQAVAVVDNLSFDLHSGKTLALVGESGSGKSMTALSLMRILPEPPALPSEGEVLYQGNNLLALPERKMRKIRGSKIAMIFQDPMSALNPVYTIGDQLAEVVHLHLGLRGKEVRERICAALADVGIPSPAQTIRDYPHQLSGGMQQRVMIAMALMCEPDILIADEPTTALDVTIQAQVLDLMSALQEKRGMATLLITHDMGVVAEIADEVVVMYAGQAVERGPVTALFDQMAHPYTQGLFRSRPRIDRPRAPLQAIVGTVPAAHQMPAGCRFHPRCAKAMPCCRQGPVPTSAMKAPGHETACWLYESEEADG